MQKKVISPGQATVSGATFFLHPRNSVTLPYNMPEGMRNTFARYKATYFPCFLRSPCPSEIDWNPSINTRKTNSRKTVRAATILRPPLESSRRGESKFAWSSPVKAIFDIFFKITFQIISEHDWTKQNRIRLVEYSCSEVSGPSEVPRFVRELIFKLFKEVKLICVCLIIPCSRVPAIF